MGFGDPDHQHPLTFKAMKEEANCFRCELPVDCCYGCTSCNYFVHFLCSRLPEKMRPLHPNHTLTLLPFTTSQITSDCNHCHKPFLSGYTYSCQECLKFNLHLKGFPMLNLEIKHRHPFSLYEDWDMYGKDCCICGLLIDDSESYTFACKDCKIFIHYDCTFIPQTVKHRHVHELTFEYTFTEGSKNFDCDICLNKDGKELDRTLSYYYCERCGYIAHVRCVTSKPSKVATQLEQLIHEHPMILLRRNYTRRLRCAACKCIEEYWSIYFCSICNYGVHKSCVEFPRLIKHPRHGENHALSLQFSASQNKNA